MIRTAGVVHLIDFEYQLLEFVVYISNDYQLQSYQSLLE